MSIELKGENLIFLISQPRAGSTLLQQILGNHPEIHTLPETWIALPTLHALYTRKIDRRYNSEYSRYCARTAIEDFVQHLPNGEEDYLEGVRKMYAHLYGRAMEASGKKFFLDKGPRYYQIIPELYKVFPDAKFVILMRNPLAVLISIINKWVKKDWDQLRNFKTDLLNGPAYILQGLEVLGDEACIMRYKDVLKSPEAEIRKICEKLNVEFSKDMLNYGFMDEYKDSLGYKEQKEEYRSGLPDAQNVDRWTSHIKDPQVWRLASDYLHYLEKDVISRMGYSYSEIEKILDQCHPGQAKLRKTTQLHRLIKRSEINYILENQRHQKLPKFLERYLRYILP